jgi:hypothetical protein
MASPTSSLAVIEEPGLIPRRMLCERWGLTKNLWLRPTLWPPKPSQAS